jgi:ribosome-associated protein YbcJ (S4-like RNA binding protein)
MGGGVCLERAVTLRKSKKLMSQMVLRIQSVDATHALNLAAGVS